MIISIHESLSTSVRYKVLTVIFRSICSSCMLLTLFTFSLRSSSAESWQLTRSNFDLFIQCVVPSLLQCLVTLYAKYCKQRGFEYIQDSVLCVFHKLALVNKLFLRVLLYLCVFWIEFKWFFFSSMSLVRLDVMIWKKISQVM